jgi:hypothetical protein
MSPASLQYVQASVNAAVNDVPYNPTADPVAFAFLAPGASVFGAQWWTGSWASTQSANGGTSYTAQCLVGPGGTVQLATGTYQVWVRITDNPEVPVLPAYLLTITS